MGEIRSFFAERGAEYPQLAEQAEVIGDFSQLSHSFATVFDNNRQIRDNASPELMRLRSRIVELERQTKRYVNNVLQNKEYQKYFQDALVTVRNNRYVIPHQAGIPPRLSRHRPRYVSQRFDPLHRTLGHRQCQ